jgi:hypothetical protein
MLKLPLIVLALLGTCAAGTCTAQEPHSLTQLQNNARMLIVFAPNPNSPSFKRQLELIERHSFELSIRNTVVVPVSTASKLSDELFTFENLPLGTPSEQADARSRFHVNPGDFLVILLDQIGSVQIRSAAPVDIHELVASLDSLPDGH